MIPRAVACGVFWWKAELPKNGGGWAREWELWCAPKGDARTHCPKRGARCGDEARPGVAGHTAACSACLCSSRPFDRLTTMTITTASEHTSTRAHVRECQGKESRPRSVRGRRVRHTRHALALAPSARNTASPSRLASSAQAPRYVLLTALRVAGAQNNVDTRARRVRALFGSGPRSVRFPPCSLPTPATAAAPTAACGAQRVLQSAARHRLVLHLDLPIRPGATFS
jgi:hypothetical protein